MMQEGNPAITNLHLNFIGVIQIFEEEKFIGFALGIYYDDRLVSLADYFQNGRKPRKAYFRKQGQNEPNANTFQINLREEFIKDYEELETQGSTQPLGQSGYFVQIKLKNGQERDRPLLISTKNLNYNNYDSGIAIGINNSLNSEKDIRLIAKSFDPKQIDSLNLALSAGVLLLKSTTQTGKQLQLLYGFYQNLGEKQLQGKDYFLYEESLEGQAQNQLFVNGNNVAQVDFPFKRIPYNSIGLLGIVGRYVGTASFLLSKDGTCRFIITCGHNFYGSEQNKGKYQLFDFTTPDQLKLYKFWVPRGLIPQRPRLNVPDFQIKRVYIPDQYKFFVNQFVDKNGQIKPQKIDFPQIAYNGESAEEERGIYIGMETFHDIAIAELETPLKLGIGFKIRPAELPFDQINKKKIEVAGFPRQEQTVKTIHGKMYYESTQKHDVSYTRLSKKLNEETGWKVLKHKLSTLGGNSGSPIYEKIGDKCYLFGIHTAGFPRPLLPGEAKKTWGKYNFGTYLYSENIEKWFKSIGGIQEVLE